MISLRCKLDKNNANAEEVHDIDKHIAEIIAEEEKCKANKFVKYCDQTGVMNIKEMWNLKKKLWPKKETALPIAKKNHSRRIISSPLDLRTMLLKEYTEI